MQLRTQPRTRNKPLPTGGCTPKFPFDDPMFFFSRLLEETLADSFFPRGALSMTPSNMVEKKILSSTVPSTSFTDSPIRQHNPV